MATRLYVEQENGNLKFIAEDDEAPIENAALVVDELLDSTNTKDREFIALDIELGGAVVIEVETDEPVQPKRRMKITGRRVAPSEDAATEEEVEEEDEAPAPKPKPRRTAAKRSTAAKKGNAKKSASTKKAAASKAGKASAKKPSGSASKKATAKKASSKPKINKKGGGGFKRNAASEE